MAPDDRYGAVERFVTKAHRELRALAFIKAYQRKVQVSLLRELNRIAATGRQLC